MIWRTHLQWFFVFAAVVLISAAPRPADASTHVAMSGQEGPALALLEMERRMADLHERGAPDLLEQRLEPAPGLSARSGGEDAGFLGIPSDLPLKWRLLVETAGGAAVGTGGALVGAGLGVAVGAIVAAAVVSNAGGGGGGVGSGSIHPQAVLILPMLARSVASYFQAVAVLGGIVGTYATFPAGIYWGGKLAGGEGTAGWTYLGMLSGMATAVGLGFGIGALSNETAGQLTGLLGMAVLPVTGSFLGYELSNAANSRRPATGARIRPSLALQSSRGRDGIDGLVAGVGIRF